VSKASWMNLGGTELLGSVTITAGDDLFTLAAHGLAEGDLVSFRDPTGGAVGILVEDAEYYVRNPSTDDFQVSSTPGGNVLDFALGGAADAYGAEPAYSAQELRRVGAVMLHPGVADRTGAREGVRPHSSAPVTVAGTTYTVAEGVAVVYPRETSTSGAYVVEYDAVSSALNPADGSNPRLDGVDLQVQDDDEDGDGQRRARIVYVPGTPASDPTAPAVTSGALRLATIRVYAGGTPGPEVEDEAQFALGPGVLPVRTTSERPTAGLFDGVTLFRQDTGVLEARYSGAWATLAATNGYQYSQTVRFTASGTFTKASYPNARMIRVKLVGGGGAGAGVETTIAGDSDSGGGGGGGCYAESELQVSSLASSVTVTVGAGATSVSDSNGAAGGTTSFGAHVIGPGGGGGFTLGASDNPRSTSGGLGGTGGTGDLVIPGGGGGGSHTFYTPDIVVEYGLWGHGGGTHLGGATRTARGPSTAPESGSLYGGGGTGVVNGPSTAARAAGNGAAGICIVEVFV
jgi:hypothetical protein